VVIFNKMSTGNKSASKGNNNRAPSNKGASSQAKPASTSTAAKTAAPSTQSTASAAPTNSAPAASTSAAGSSAAPKARQPRQKKSVVKGISKKIQKRQGRPTAYESQVAQALYDVQSRGEGFAALKDLHITAAKEYEVGSGKQATVLFVPVPQLKKFRAIQSKLVQELEKSAAFRDRQIFIVANRTILKAPTKKNRISQQKRPRSRTATAVHEAVLDDLVFPSEIVGKSVRVKLDNSRVIKVQLDPKDRERSKNKTEAYSRLYKRLTGKVAVFEFPAYSLADLQGHLAAEKASRSANK